MGEKAGGGGRQEETVKGSKHMSAPGRRVCVQSTRDQGMDGITEVPAACPHPVFFHFEVPAAQQSLGCPTTGIEGSRRDPIPPQGAGGGEQLGGRGAGDWHTVSSGGRVGKSPSTPLPCRMGLHIDPRPQAGPSGASSAPASGKAPGLRS